MWFVFIIIVRLVCACVRKYAEPVIMELIKILNGLLIMPMKAKIDVMQVHFQFNRHRGRPIHARTTGHRPLTGHTHRITHRHNGRIQFVIYSAGNQLNVASVAFSMSEREAKPAPMQWNSFVFFIRESASKPVSRCSEKKTHTHNSRQNIL